MLATNVKYLTPAKQTKRIVKNQVARFQRNNHDVSKFFFKLFFLSRSLKHEFLGMRLFFLAIFHLKFNPTQRIAMIKQKLNLSLHGV